MLLVLAVLLPLLLLLRPPLLIQLDLLLPLAALGLLVSLFLLDPEGFPLLVDQLLLLLLLLGLLLLLLLVQPLLVDHVCRVRLLQLPYFALRVLFKEVVLVELSLDLLELSCQLVPVRHVVELPLLHELLSLNEVQPEHAQGGGLKRLRQLGLRLFGLDEGEAAVVLVLGVRQCLQPL